MKKILLASAAAIALATGAAAALTSPAAGEWTYRNAGPAEAALYGLHTESVDAGDVTLRVYRGGTAPGRETLVLLHGYSADRQVWPRFARHLLDRYEVIIPDLAGHGDTGFTTGLDYGAPAQAARVIRMLDTLGIERAHFAGNSMGGFIAAHLGLGWPDRTASVTLVDPAGIASPEPSDMDRLLATGRNPFEVRSRAEFDEFYSMTMAQPPWLPDSVMAYLAQDYQQRRSELAEIFTALRRPDTLAQRLAEIRSPALVIWGREDRLIDVSVAPLWQQGLPASRLEIMDGIGHMPMVEVPERTAALVAGFLASLPR